MKKLLSLLLSFSLLMSSAITVSASTLSGWSADYFARGEEVNLIDPSLKKIKKNNITRKNFCEIAVNFYSLYTDNPAISINLSPFMDEKSPKIVRAYELGIVNGYDDKTFKPNNIINREQMAVMLFNTLKVCNENIDNSISLKTDFKDSNEISDYAKNAIKVLQQEKILSGMDGGYNPSLNVTVEQAVCAFVNAYDLFVGKSFKIGNNDIIIGESKNSVVKKLGNPDRIDKTDYNGEKYVYNKDLNTFIVVGIKNNMVVEMFSNAPTMEYCNLGTNSSLNDCSLNSLANIVSTNVISFVDKKITAYLYGDNFTKKLDLIYIRSNDLTPSSNVINDDIIQSIENELSDLISVKRHKENLKPLSSNKFISEISQEHSENMKSHKYIDYTNIEGITPFKRLTDNDIKYNSAGEVICSTAKNAIDAYTYFLNGFGNRSILLNPKYTDYGIGISRERLKYYVTIDFIEKL